MGTKGQEKSAREIKAGPWKAGCKSRIKGDRGAKIRKDQETRGSIRGRCKTGQEKYKDNGSETGQGKGLGDKNILRLTDQGTWGRLRGMKSLDTRDWERKQRKK